jgi:hypothetical protein
MPSSTSSSENPPGQLSWLSIFGGAILIFSIFVSLMEYRLAQLNFHVQVVDSEERWLSERARASRLGSKALILVGRSRFQLGIDLDALRQGSGLEPVQLAIDGASAIPLLDGLAGDPTITGTILVEYYAGDIGSNRMSGDDRAGIWEAEYEKKYRDASAKHLSATLEKTLSEDVYDNLRSYADGATPLMSLQRRILSRAIVPQYVFTRPDRSKLADFSRTAMPDRYYSVVAGYVRQAEKTDLAPPYTERRLEEKIDGAQAFGNENYVQGINRIRQMKSLIESRGGKVIFVKMPMSGMVLELDNKLFPRVQFQDLFSKAMAPDFYSSSDEPTLKAFTCPEGSHLDLRDRTPFTLALVHTVGFSGKH